MAGLWQVLVGECDHSVTFLGVLSKHLLEVFWDSLPTTELTDFFRRPLNEGFIRLIKVIFANYTHSLQL